jgi:hypothetical protein
MARIVSFDHLTEREWREKVVLLLQLLATAAVLGWVLDNRAKLAVMLVIWAAGFGRVSLDEIIMMVLVNLLFIGMNTAALARRIFRFDHPDLLGMSIYEFAMWGFYTLHALRMLDGGPPRDKRIAAVILAGIFAVPFATIGDPLRLLLASSVALAACLMVFHDAMDWGYAVYMAALGALIEYVGVWTGQRHYPGQPYGGVPLWFVTMWAGVGVFARRLILPLLCGGGRLSAMPQGKR